MQIAKPYKHHAETDKTPALSNMLRLMSNGAVLVLHLIDFIGSYGT